MGREATCGCVWPGGEGRVKAVLESRKLILRGDLRLNLATADLGDLEVIGEALRFRCAIGAVELRLGAAEAQKWAKKLSVPPPTLAEKLGIAGGRPTIVFGAVDDQVLANALRQADVTGATERPVAFIAVAGSEPELCAALVAHAEFASSAPIWVAYPRGPKATFGETAVRQLMRGSGFIDNKATAISDTLTGTRYVRPRSDILARR
jgi:hypothetical protein